MKKTYEKIISTLLTIGHGFIVFFVAPVIGIGFMLFIVMLVNDGVLHPLVGRMSFFLFIFYLFINIAEIIFFIDDIKTSEDNN